MRIHVEFEDAPFSENLGASCGDALETEPKDDVNEVNSIYRQQRHINKQGMSTNKVKHSCHLVDLP